MMSSKNKHFTASDIERYHSGQLSAKERHALEKAALDDPFLADALEGYAFTSTPVADLAKIKTRLDEKLDRKKVVPFFKRYQWLSAAAVLVIVAGAGWFVYNNISNEKTSIAKASQEDKQQPSQEVTKIVEQKLADTTVGNSNNVVTISPLKSKNSNGTFETYKPVEEVHAFTPPEEKKQEQESGVNIENALNRARTRQAEIPQRSSDGYIDSRNGVTNMNRNISPDPNANYRNNAISNRSNIILKEENDSNRGDIANRKERSQSFTQPDTIKNFNVVLEQDKTGLNEVVIASKDAERNKLEKYPKVIIDTLEPAGGYVKFDDYIAQNLKMPEELTDKSISGEVQLSFEVDNSGKPTNITVVKSLCEKCDEEAIRLLKEGPKWKKKKNKKGKITIKF